MAFRDLRQFLAFLEQKGELRRIQTAVSCDLEITEIADRTVKSNGPALLFENVQGSNIPLALNLFGSAQRMAWALGVASLDDLAPRLRHLLSLVQGPPGPLMEKLKALGTLARLASFQPKTVRQAPCQEVVQRGEEATLAGLPILKCWPEDGGPYITFPLVITKNPKTGKRNVGTYRMQVYDERTLGLHWHRHKGGAQHLRQETSGERLEVAVALGGDPTTLYTGTAPLPPDGDEFFLAGFLRQEAVEVVKGLTVDLEVPAHSEIILEGYVDPQEERREGPFGDHTGYYSLPESYPVFHLTCLTRRAAPIYVTTIVGRPPMEDAYLGQATERLFLPLIQAVLPEVVDIHMPPHGVFHNLLLVSIRKDYPGQARKVMYGLWGMGLLMLTKTIIVVDHYVNVRDLAEVAWRVSTNIDPARDLVVVEGPLDALDHASPTPYYGSKLGIDATAKGPLEGRMRPWPPDIVMSPEIKALVDRRWHEYGL